MLPGSSADSALGEFAAGDANLFVAPRASGPLLSPRMFQLLPLIALAGLLLVFTSCERHHPGEMPEVQREHLHPLQPGMEEAKPAFPAPPVSPTPANFFPNEKP